jgi:hypothetical protein
MADNQTAEVPQNAQLSREVSTLARKVKGTDRVSSRYSIKDFKPYLDAIQRVVCLALAVWVIFHYNNLWEFIAILAVSRIDPRGAKDILVRVLKGVVSECK